MTLTSISIDRWYAICHPLKFKSTTSRARTAIIIIWIVGLASGNKIINSIWYRKGNDDSRFYRSDPFNMVVVYERDDFFLNTTTIVNPLVVFFFEKTFNIFFYCLKCIVVKWMVNGFIIL